MGYVYEIVAGDDDTFAIVRSEHLSVEDLERTRSLGTLQSYDPRLERVFPIRDPAHPHWVHPNYASPQDPSRCSSQVKLLSITLEASTLDHLWALAGPAEPLPRSGDRDATAAKSKFGEQIIAACRNELEATLRGESPPSQRALEVVRIRPEHCRGPEEAAALVGQYGVILSDQGLRDQPTLATGRILCFFSDARLDAERAAESHLTTDAPDDEADARQRVPARKFTPAPHPGGTMAQYVNTAFRAAEGSNVFVDQQACNASLHSATVELSSIDEHPLSETMLFLALHRELHPNEQIRLDYDPY